MAVLPHWFEAAYRESHEDEDPGQSDNRDDGVPHPVIEGFSPYLGRRVIPRTRECLPRRGDALGIYLSRRLRVFELLTLFESPP